MIVRCTLLLLAWVGAGVVHAQTFPQKPLRMIVPSSPGGGSDILGRFLAQKLSDQMGQPVVVENRPGASSMLGTELAAKSAPDGYTLVIPPAAVTVNPSIFAKMPYDTLRDLAPITLVADSANVLVAHPALPVRSVKDLVALAKAKPGALAVASPGISGTPHMAAELFKLMTGVDLLIVIYKGSGPGSIALIAGEVSLQFSTPPSSLPYVRTGRMRALGVTTKARVQAMPDVPTIAESGVPGYEATQWFGILAPADTAKDIVSKLHSAIVAMTGAPKIAEQFAAVGAEPVGSSPAEFAAFIQAEISKWGKVVKSGVSLD